MPLSFLLFIFSSFSSFSSFLLLLLFFFLLLFVFSCPPLSHWSLPHEFLPLDLGLATGWPHLGIVNLIAYSRTPLLNEVTLEDSRTRGMGIAFQRALQTTAILDLWQLASTNVPKTNESWALRNWLTCLSYHEPRWMLWLNLMKSKKKG